MRGAKDVAARLKDIAIVLKDSVSAELEAVAKEAMETAQGMAPVGSGESREKRLVDSFSYEANGLTAVMQVENPHAAYVEFGTGRRGAASTGVAPVGVSYDPGWPGMAAQPYMYPTAQLMRGDFAARMAGAARNALKERK